MEVNSAECSDCGGDVARLEQGEACPSCAATARTMGASAVSLVAMSTLTVEATVGYSDQPTWDRQWNDLRAAYDSIKDYYAGATSMDNQEARRTVLAGCSSAWSLAEHLADGKSAKTYRDGDPDLGDASAVTNTWKHAGRDPGKTVGRIARDTGRADGTNVIELEIIPPGQPARTRDALGLLEACLDKWAAHLRSGGEPVDWPPAEAVR